MINPTLVNKISDIMLQLVEESQELTQSDLQGRAGAEAMNIINLVKQSQ